MKGNEPRIEDQPDHEQGRRNQARGTCGGTRWRYVGGDCLGWWQECKGCKGCEEPQTTLAERQAAVRLAMRDALQWTDPTTLNSEAFTVLSKGIEMLGWSTFSSTDEENWLQDLLEAGWHIAPAREAVQ